MSDTTTTPVRNPALDKMVEALRLGREAVMESFDHAQSRDDTYLAEARLRDIDDALSRAEAAISSAPPSVEGWQPGEEFQQWIVRAYLKDAAHFSPFTMQVAYWAGFERAMLYAAPVHASDCALHNEPALPKGPCDCGLAAAPVPPQKGEEDSRVDGRWTQEELRNAVAHYTRDSAFAERCADVIANVLPSKVVASPPSPAPLAALEELTVAIESGEVAGATIDKARAAISRGRP